MRKRDLTALCELYHRPPANEHIERDFKKSIEDAWCAVAELYDFLSACHKDGLLMGIARSPDKVLKDLADIRDGLCNDSAEIDFELDLDLPPDSPAAEFRDGSGSLTSA